MPRQTFVTACFAWIVVVGVMLSFAGLSGRLHPELVPDSPSYLKYSFGSLEDVLRSQRMPGYPLLLMLMGRWGTAVVPLVQWLLHASVCAGLIIELGRWGMPVTARWSAGLAVGLGCTALDHLAVVATDGVAATAGVMTVAGLLGWIRTGRTVRWGAVTCTAAVAAIALRPAYLSLIPWITVAGVMLMSRRGAWPRRLSARHSVASSALLSVAVAIPVLTWMSLRGAMVADFGILPFGHQNLAGVTVQLVSEEELLSIGEAAGGDTAALTKQIVSQRVAYEATQGELPAGSPGATMTLESRWDAYVWGIVVPAGDVLYPGDNVASHRAIQTLNQAVLARYPGRYLRWLLLSARRGAWGTAANLVMHPIFLAALATALLIEGIHVCGALTLAPTEEPDATRVLFIVALSYFVVMSGFVILTSPAIGRFIDAAAIMVPAWIAARWVPHWKAVLSSLGSNLGGSRP